MITLPIKVRVSVNPVWAIIILWQCVVYNKYTVWLITTLRTLLLVQKMMMSSSLLKATEIEREEKMTHPLFTFLQWFLTSDQAYLAWLANDVWWWGKQVSIFLNISGNAKQCLNASFQVPRQNSKLFLIVVSVHNSLRSIVFTLLVWWWWILK